jgi:acyl-CoA synthetase (AMP-forming)/AMP-acid ligase II
MMRGYWDHPDATAGTRAEGRLRTGSIGHLDAGYLFLTDRAKDVIIAGGSNVYPSEVEKVLLTHPAVREGAVAGVPDPSGASRCARSSPAARLRVSSSSGAALGSPRSRSRAR